MPSAESSSWNPHFSSPTHGPLGLHSVLDHMRSFVDNQPTASYRLLIGTDSLAGTHVSTVFVTAIVLHRLGNGGIYFLLKESYKNIVTLQQRMYQEALASIDVARHFLEHPSVPDLLQGDIEIHVDIGHRGPTKTMIREIVGMVQANGFPVRTKPDSVAASKVADRHTISSLNAFTIKR